MVDSSSSRVGSAASHHEAKNPTENTTMIPALITYWNSRAAAMMSAATVADLPTLTALCPLLMTNRFVLRDPFLVRFQAVWNAARALDCLSSPISSMMTLWMESTGIDVAILYNLRSCSVGFPGGKPGFAAFEGAHAPTNDAERQSENHRNAYREFCEIRQCLMDLFTILVVFDFGGFYHGLTVLFPRIDDTIHWLTEHS